MGNTLKVSLWLKRKLLFITTSFEDNNRNSVSGIGVLVSEAVLVSGGVLVSGVLYFCGSIEVSLLQGFCCPVC